jgi:hypothetical protein
MMRGIGRITGLERSEIELEFPPLAGRLPV